MNAGLFGKWPGTCASNQDPNDLLRIKVKVPALFGQEVLEEWALPCLQKKEIDTWTLSNTTKDNLPQPGDGVWVEFIGGDENKPIWSGLWKKK